MDIKVVRKGGSGIDTLVYLNGELCEDAVNVAWGTGVDNVVNTVVVEFLCANLSVEITDDEPYQENPEKEPKQVAHEADDSDG